MTLNYFRFCGVRPLIFTVLLVFNCDLIVGQDVSSGTTAGKPVPLLEAMVCVGENDGQKVELTAKSGKNQRSIFSFRPNTGTGQWPGSCASLIRKSKPV